MHQLKNETELGVIWCQESYESINQMWERRDEHGTYERTNE